MGRAPLDGGGAPFSMIDDMSGAKNLFGAVEEGAAAYRWGRRALCSIERRGRRPLTSKAATPFFHVR